MVNEAHPNEWILLCVMNKIPTEIERFISDVFQVIEIRQRVGNVRGILFEVRTNEGNHSIPHIHAKYGEFEISIEIGTGRVLAGNLPNKQQRVAVGWVQEHKKQLLKDWKNISISATSRTTRSLLDDD